MTVKNGTPSTNKAAPDLVELLICKTCKRDELEDVNGCRPGEILFEALACRDLPEGLVVRSVECLSNCKRGCSIALRGKGRWTYIYGDVNEENHVEMIIDGASRYLATDNGLIPWRERPEHFRKHCIARIPPLENQND